MTIRAPLLAGIAVALACCGPVNRSVETVKTAEIRTDRLATEVAFDAANGLSGTQARSLAQYLEAIRVGYGDRIAVDDPIVHGAAERRAAIAEIVARFGLLLDTAAPVTDGVIAPGRVRVVVTRSTATVPDCPDWRRAANPELAASAMSNYGCATVGNLAAMIADPNDLTTAQPYAGADSTAIRKATELYRRRVPSGVEEAAGIIAPGSGN